MDGAAAAESPEDGAGRTPRDAGGRASENSVGPSAEDTAERVGVFCCRDCGEAFREEAAYLEHRHQHLQESACLDEQLDNLHDAEKDSETANFCSLCSLSFVEPSEFLSHMEKNHAQTSQKESSTQINSGITKHTYECPDCGKCYVMIGHFLNHQRSHKQAAKSLFHDLEHLEKKPFQCESCGRNYSRASALDAHRRCHEEKLVKSGNKSSGDAVHTEEPIVEAKPSENQTDDTPEKLFTCSCGKAFTALMRLKTHQRFSRNSQCSPEETIEKPKKSPSEFYCSECKKTFHGHIALFNHQRWHANQSDDSAKRFSCEECGKEFVSLAFYYRHQRTAHSNETPAKSFLHQVCQLQKKGFQCKDCGLKFSRASALHSHELQHSDVFKETEGAAQKRTSLLPQDNISESDRPQTGQEQPESDNTLSSSMAEEDLHVNDTDEDGESYEPGDFNVQVISASESEDEPAQDLNPDLELLCESDQEARDDGDADVSTCNIVSEPGMDLKIVQIDFEQAETQCAPIAGEAKNKATGERFHCPDCYRWFSSAASLRVHRVWHDIHKKRQQTQVKRGSLACKECGLKFTDQKVFQTHLHQHALQEEEEEEDDDEEEKEEAQIGRNPAADLDSGRGDDGENGGVGVATYSMKRKLPNGYTCLVCGKVYTYLVSFRKHQQLHENQAPITKSVPNLRKYECPECGVSFIRRARLLGHLRLHRSGTSLKLKPYKCDQCNKDFASPKSWMFHMKLHKRYPFWCLSCAKGFKEEASLDRHLQSHNLGHLKHNSFQMSTHLRKYYTTHSGAKPYQCTGCEKRFSHLGNLIIHRKRYYGLNVGSSRKSCAFIPKKQARREGSRLILTSAEEEPEMDTNTGAPPVREESETRKPRGDAEFGDHADSEESDCGEPVRHLKLSKPLGSTESDSSDEWKSESEQLHSGQELDESDFQETDVDGEQKFWEWECCDCDMGFDEVAELHMHYIKHATGELPMLLDE